MKKITLALLLTKPGHLRKGLQSLLRTVPQIEIIAESSDPSILAKVNEEIHPELIVVDAAIIDSENWSEIANLKAGWPETRVLVLTENDAQGQAAREAGADLYQLKGFPATELAKLIESSLSYESAAQEPVFGKENLSQ